MEAKGLMHGMLSSINHNLEGPLGSKPFETEEGIKVYAWDECPMEVQLLWRGPKLVAITNISAPVPNVNATAITVNPTMHEAIRVSISRAKARHGTNKPPTPKQAWGEIWRNRPRSN